MLGEYGMEGENGDFEGGMGLLDGNYHGTSFGQLPDGSTTPDIDPSSPEFAKLTRKQ